MIEFDRRAFLSMIPAVSIAELPKFEKVSGPTNLQMSFSEIPIRFIHPDTDTLFTSGYSSHGDLGEATYVSDHLATPALAQLSPRFCTVGADGRCWRAAVGPDGLVPVAAGGAVGSLRVKLTRSGNQQPAIAQALIYQYVVGAAGLLFEDGNYQIWCPLRTAVDENINADKSGIPFLIRRPTVFQAGPNGTTFSRRKFDGSDPAKFSGTQYLNLDYARNGQGLFWRGGMFMLVGAPDPRPQYAQLAALHLKGNWIIDGGTTQSLKSSDRYISGTAPFGGLYPDGSGWDITDKPIWAENDRHTGDIIFDGNIAIGGFRGELVYQGGITHGSIYQTGTLTLHDTDGDGFNPGPSFSNGSPGGFGTVQLQSLTIANAFQALEGATGWNSNIALINIRNCTQAGGLISGIWGLSRQPANRPPPVLAIRTVKIYYSGAYVALSGNNIQDIVAIDTTCYIGQYNMTTNNVKIKQLTITADRANIADGLVFFSSASDPNLELTSNNHVAAVTLAQTATAQLSNYAVIDPVDCFGAFGNGNLVDELNGVAWIAPWNRNPASVTGQSPQIHSNKLRYL